MRLVTKIANMQFIALLLTTVKAFDACAIDEVANAAVNLNEGSTSQEFEALLPGMRNFEDTVDSWDRSVRGFRSGHTFRGTYGSVNGTWKIDGTVDESDEVLEYRQRIDTTADSWMFEYTFHIPLMKGFGYYLGSSTGVLLNEWSKKRDLTIDKTIYFPGLTTGFAINFTPAIRAMIGIDTQLIRYERFRSRIRDESPRKSTAFFSAYGLRFNVGLDVFLRLNWGLILQVESSQVEGIRVGESAGSLLGLKRQHDSKRLVGGIVYHLI